LTIVIEDARRTEGDDVDRRRGRQQEDGADAAREDGFDHSAGSDLGSVLDTYARPDRRVLDRRARTPDDASFESNDRRVRDRRSPTPEDPPEESHDGEVPPAVDPVAEAPNVVGANTVGAAENGPATEGRPG
jgi:hypothetical protein